MWSLFLFAILSFVFVQSKQHAQQDAQQGPHSFKVNQTQNFQVGDFSVTFSNDVLDVLRVTHKNNPNNTLWESHQPFASVDFILEKNTQRDGTIKVVEEYDERQWPSCVDMSVASITQGNSSSLTLKGYICSSYTKKLNVTLSYLMTLSIHPTSTYQLVVAFEIFGFPQQMVYRPHVVVNYVSPLTEKFFGFGEQYTYLNLRGQQVPMITREKGTGRGLQPITWVMNHFYNGGGGSTVSSYMAVPMYFTSELRSLYFFNTEYMMFDLDSKFTGQIHVKLNSTSVEFAIIGRSSFLDIITEYTGYSGRMKPLPKWVGQGTILGLEGGTEAIIERMEQLKQVAPDMPISGVWFQDWSGLRSFPTRLGLWWNWELDATLYHDWNNLTNYLKNYSPNGVRILTYVNPMLANINGKKTPTTHNYKQIAADSNYLVKEAVDDKGDTKVWNGYNKASLIDLSNPKAREFLKGLIKDNMLAQNHSGWMADFGEAYPLGAVAYDEAATGPPATYHNKYPYEWQKVNQEAISEMGMSDEILYFCRSGTAKSPGVTSSFWVGDQLVTWDNFDGLKAALTAMLSLGLSGFTLTHSDTGGYVMLHIAGVDYRRTKELFCRWNEMSAFTAISRTHPGTLPSSSWQFYSDNSTILEYSKFSKVYQSLAEYREQLMQEAYSKGYPLMRPLFLHYPSDPIAFTLHLQYMLGSDMMIAPVLEPEVTEVEVYLPAGSWTHVWSNETYTSTKGMWIVVAAPIGEPGIFYKANSTTGAVFVKNLQTWGVL